MGFQVYNFSGWEMGNIVGQKSLVISHPVGSAEASFVVARSFVYLTHQRIRLFICPPEAANAGGSLIHDLPQIPLS